MSGKAWEPGQTSPIQPSRSAKGVIRAKGAQHHRSAMRVFTVAFDEDTVAEVNAAAETQGVTFSEMVRRLVEWGLLTPTDA